MQNVSDKTVFANGSEVFMSFLKAMIIDKTDPFDLKVPEECGDWLGIASTLYDAYCMQYVSRKKGRDSTIFDDAIKQEVERSPNFALLLPKQEGQSNETQSSVHKMPPLEALTLVDQYESRDIDARIPDVLDESIRAPLDEYITWSEYWVPRAPRIYHEALALSMYSIVAARRIHVLVQGPLYPYLYPLFCSKPGIFAKSRAVTNMREVLKSADLEWLLISEEMTPEAYIRDAAGYVEDAYEGYSEEYQKKIKDTMRLAGQRSIYRDEAGTLFNAAVSGTGVNAKWKNILLENDTGKDIMNNKTIGRGDNRVYNPYLSAILCMTIQDFLSLPKDGAGAYQSGLLSRMIVMTPADSEINFRKRPYGKIEVPEEIWKRLRHFHDMLPMPEADIVEIRDKKGEGTGKFKVQYLTDFESQPTYVDPEVYDAFQNYDDSLRFMVNKSEYNIPEELSSNYQRLAIQAMKFATLMAWMQDKNPGRITIQIWWHCQRIAEDCRKSLHEFFSQTRNSEATPEGKREQVILNIIKRKGGWAKFHEIKSNIRGISTEQLQKALDWLCKPEVGTLSCVPTLPRRGPQKISMLYGYLGEDLPSNCKIAEQADVTDKAKVAAEA